MDARIVMNLVRFISAADIMLGGIRWVNYCEW